MEKDLIPLKPVPIAWILSTFSVFIISGVTVWILWDNIPDPFPIHWGPDGQPDDWQPKNAGSIIGFLALSGGVLGTMTGIVPWLIHHHAKQAHEGLPKKAPGEINRTRAIANEMMILISRVLFGVTVLTMVWIVYSLIGSTWFSVPGWLILPAAVIILVLAINGVRKAEQRINTQGGLQVFEAGEPWRPFYYAPEDKRMWIDDNSSFILNFGHKGSWLLIALVLSPVVIALLIAFSE